MSIRKILAALLCLFTVFALVACGGGETPCTEHVDEDANGACDVCGEAVEPEDPKDPDALYLIENGKANFTFVVSSDVSSGVIAAVDKVIANLASAGITATRVDETSTPTECEILVGNITSRGADYAFDTKSIGSEGYAIKLVGKKIIIVSNSSETLADTVKEFAEETLGIKKGVTEISTLSVTDSINVTKEKGKFRITSIKIDGELIDGMYILVDREDENLLASATAFKTAILQRYGSSLEILGSIPANDTRKYVEFKKVDDAGAGGYKISVQNGCLIFETEFPHKAKDVTQSFINTNISIKTGDISFKAKFSYTESIRKIYYSDFGAKGDGSTDDFLAIKKAHDYANKYGHIPCADAGARYYIGNTSGVEISVMTDVDWGNATFIIDDKTVAFTDASREADIFVMRSEYEAIRLEADHPVVVALNAAGGIDADTITNIGYAPGFKAMLIPYDTTHRVYIRSGVHAAEDGKGGSEQHELILIDEEGNIIEGSGFLLDYANVSFIDVYRVDDKPITLQGGTFITKANDAPGEYTYYKRGLGINRSNVTIKNVVHKIEEEGDHGAPYTGFINPYYMNNLLVEGVTLQGHKTYREESTGLSSMGTYDIAGSNANNLYFKNCTQSNFFDANGKPNPESSYWGIMGTNYCKNITYDGSTLSRLDAHAGVLNASVINGSVVSVINLIGGGKALVSDSTVYSTAATPRIIGLRGDYGSTWKGTIEIRNVTFAHTSTSKAYIVQCSWENWDFGYTTYMPEKIIVDNLKVTSSCSLYFIGPCGTQLSIDPDAKIGTEQSPNKNPMVPLKEAIVLNNTQNNQFAVSDKDWLCALVQIKYTED